MASSAHGVVNNHIGETDAVKRLMELPLRNTPPTRPSTDDSHAQADNGWRCRDGTPSDFFLPEVELTEERNGPWVKVRMDALRVQGSTWRLSNDQLWEEVMLWHDTNRSDIEHGRTAHDAKKAGKQFRKHRPRAKRFVVTEDCFVDEAKGNIYDLRAYWDAPADARHTVPIPLMQFAEDNTSFNADALQAACDKARVPDALMAQAVCQGGVWRPFSGEWSMVLEPNSKGFYEHLDFAQQTTTDELESGVLQGTYEGPPFMPCKYHSRNVALQFRAGKIKPRGTGNLSLHGDYQHHGTNSGWALGIDLANFPDLDYITSELFARDCGIVKTAFDRLHGFEIRKNDWYDALIPPNTGTLSSSYMHLSEM